MIEMGGCVHIINQRLCGNQEWVRSMRSEEGRTLYAMLELFIRHYMRLDFTAQKFEGYLIVYAGERSFLIISSFGWDRNVDRELVVYLEDAIIRQRV